MPLLLNPLISHRCARLENIRVFLGYIQVITVTASVGFFALVQDDDGIYDIIFHVVHPEVGVYCRSLSEPINWVCNIAVIPGKGKSVFTWSEIRWGRKVISATRLNML